MVLLFFGDTYQVVSEHLIIPTSSKAYIRKRAQTAKNRSLLTFAHCVCVNGTCSCATFYCRLRLRFTIAIFVFVHKETMLYASAPYVRKVITAEARSCASAHNKEWFHYAETQAQSANVYQNALCVICFRLRLYAVPWEVNWMLQQLGLPITNNNRKQECSVCRKSVEIDLKC